jgi:CRP-like cAMP-binding protein
MAEATTIAKRPQSRVQSQNRLLASLSSADFALLQPHLADCELVLENVLISPGNQPTHVYFPQSGAVSLVTVLKTGEMIEAAMVGRDGVIGDTSMAGNHPAFGQAIVQLPGSASRIAVQHLRDGGGQSATIRQMLSRYREVIFAQAQQSAACHAVHDVEERMCRWLLQSRDLMESDTLPLTQGFLAEMLGVRRTTVTLVARKLQAAELIKYRRGRIQIVDVEGLRDAACECYETTKDYYRQLFPGHR